MSYMPDIPISKSHKMKKKPFKRHRWKNPISEKGHEVKNPISDKLISDIRRKATYPIQIIRLACRLFGLLHY